MASRLVDLAYPVAGVEQPDHEHYPDREKPGNEQQEQSEEQRAPPGGARAPAPAPGGPPSPVLRLGLLTRSADDRPADRRASTGARRCLGQFPGSIRSSRRPTRSRISLPVARNISGPPSMGSSTSSWVDHPMSCSRRRSAPTFSSQSETDWPRHRGPLTSPRRTSSFKVNVRGQAEGSISTT